MDMLLEENLGWFGGTIKKESLCAGLGPLEGHALNTCCLARLVEGQCGWRLFKKKGAKD